MSNQLRSLPPVINDTYPHDFPDDYTHFLKAVCKLGRYQTIVEIGVQFGSTTLRLCESAKFTNGKVFGYDIFEQIGNYPDNPAVKKEAVEKRLLDAGIDESLFKITKVNTRSSEFDEILNQDIPGTIDFAFVDADHSYDGVMSDFFKVYSRMSNDGTIVLHDTFNHVGVRKFVLDLQTKYNDGTFDVINLPFGYRHYRCGVTLITKRVHQIYPKDMVWDSAPTDTPQINKDILYDEELQLYNKFLKK